MEMKEMVKNVRSTPLQG